MKICLSVFVAVAMLATPAWASMTVEGFDDVRYDVGESLSVEWNMKDLFGTGILDIDTLAETNNLRGTEVGKCVKLIADDPTNDPAYSTKRAQSWQSAAGNYFRVDGKMWFGFDIKSDLTASSDFIWEAHLCRNTGASTMWADGGFNSVRLGCQAGADDVILPLAAGWNQVVIMNDSTIPVGSDNLFMWLNGSLVASMEGSGDTGYGSGSKVQRWSIVRIGRGEAYEGNVYFDNMVGADEPIPLVPEPATLVLLGLGLVGLMRRRRA